jgi:hypothetical protein
MSVCLSLDLPQVLDIEHLLMDFDDSSEWEKAHLDYEKSQDEYIEHFISVVGEKPFATHPNEDGVYHIVSPNCINWGKPWRSTRIDSLGPSGHEEHHSFRKAVESLVREYQLSLDTVIVNNVTG